MKKTISIVLAILVVLAFSIFALGCNSSSGSTSSNTCASCGRSWNAGDPGGNYMSIAKTSMCKNCYNNFKWAEGVKDEYSSRK